MNSSEVTFGWSVGDFGICYDFTGKNTIVDANFVKLNVSFEKINLTLSTSLTTAYITTNGSETYLSYNSFWPVELIYSPFKWEYAHISIYGRGGWGIIFNEDMSAVSSSFFFGSAGIRIGLFPIKSDSLNYDSFFMNVFSEYTLRNEFKLGASIDLLFLVSIWQGIKSVESDEENGHNILDDF